MQNGRAGRLHPIRRHRPPTPRRRPRKAPRAGSIKATGRSRTSRTAPELTPPTCPCSWSPAAAAPTPSPPGSHRRALRPPRRRARGRHHRRPRPARRPAAVARRRPRRPPTWGLHPMSSPKKCRFPSATWAPKWRHALPGYAAFKKAVEATGARAAVPLGHTLDDQAENRAARPELRLRHALPGGMLPVRGRGVTYLRPPSWPAPSRHAR